MSDYLLIPLLVLGWVVCALTAEWLFEYSWRYDFDVTVGDRRFFYVMSFLISPVSLISAFIVWLMERPKSAKSERIVQKKFSR